jgi:hypothetical protein
LVEKAGALAGCCFLGYTRANERECLVVTNRGKHSKSVSADEYALKALLVRSQRLKLFVCHCEERMMQKCGAMNAT